MLRLRNVWIPALIVLSSSLTAVAGWNEAKAGWHAYWNRVHLDWHRNNAWPEPFQTMDRHATRTFQMAQTAKAWQLQTTLGHHFFDPDTQQLNVAGQYQLHWIVTQAPANHRTVYVARGENDRATNRRIDEVRRFVDSISWPQPAPEIVQTDLVPPAASGDRLDKMWEMRKGVIPAPTLPASSSN